MSNQLTENLSFEEKLKEKIKNGIGDLMSDEDLAKIVKSGIQSAFFGNRNTNSWGHPDIPINAIIREALTPLAEEQLKVWMIEHSEEIQKMIKDLIDKGEMGLVTAAFAGFVQPSFDSFTRQVDHSLVILKNNNRY